MKLFSLPSKLRTLNDRNKEFLSAYYQDSILQRQYIEFSLLQMEAVHVHNETFTKFRGCHKGESVAVIGSGPSLDKWECPPECVQIGVNGTLIAENVDLDYLFIQDYDPSLFGKMEELEYRLGDVHKFFGCHYMLPKVKPIPDYILDAFHAERYFFYDNPIKMFPFDFTIDVSSRPFITYGSTIFVALQFALYTHPKTLYIVGCDCTAGHFSAHRNEIHDKDVGGINNIIRGWNRFSTFAAALFPDVEIISMNPVGLRGMFHDFYT